MSTLTLSTPAILQVIDKVYGGLPILPAPPKPHVSTRNEPRVHVIAKESIFCITAAQHAGFYGAKTPYHRYLVRALMDEMLPSTPTSLEKVCLAQHLHKANHHVPEYGQSCMLILAAVDPMEAMPLSAFIPDV